MAHSHRLGDALPERIVIVRALRGLGDFLCAVPALRALRAALPQTHMTLLGVATVRSLVERFHQYLDELLEFPGYPGIPEREPAIVRLPSFLAEVQQRRFDLALQMHGNGIVSNPFTVILGAHYNAGFYLPGQYCPDPERFLPYPDHGSEVQRLLRLVEFLGVPARGEELEFPLTEEDHRALQSIEAARELRPGDYVCVHPGASSIEKRWPAGHFAAVANGLSDQGLKVVLTGVQDDEDAARAVAQHMRMAPLDLTGRTTLGALTALLSGARLLIGNDTGVSHLAAALRVPSVIVFTGSDPVRWAPANRQLHRPLGHGTPSPCPHIADEFDHRCLRDGCMARASAPACPWVTPEMVLAEAEDLLKLERSYAA